MTDLIMRCVLLAILMAVRCAAQQDLDDLGSHTPEQRRTEDLLLKQVVWKRCYRRLTPGCLKLNLVRTVELMSKDSSLTILPGVFFTTNSTDSLPLPPEVARSLSSEQAPLDDLAAFALGKYLRSLTLNVHLVDFISGGNKTLQNSVIDVFSGRGKKDGLGGYGAIAAMMGGMMASMMMAALAALAGKALMTSLLALMMAAFAAMKGGGDGGGESKTYEVITKPVVSHVNTHSSEIQHHDHGHYHRRSLNLDEAVGPYYKPSPTPGSPDEQKMNSHHHRSLDLEREGVPYYKPSQEQVSEEQNINTSKNLKSHNITKRSVQNENNSGEKYRNEKEFHKDKLDLFQENKHPKDNKFHISKRSLVAKVFANGNSHASAIVNHDNNNHNQEPNNRNQQNPSAVGYISLHPRAYGSHKQLEDGEKSIEEDSDEDHELHKRDTTYDNLRIGLREFKI